MISEDLMNYLLALKNSMQKPAKENFKQAMYHSSYPQASIVEMIDSLFVFMIMMADVTLISSSNLDTKRIKKTFCRRILSVLGKTIWEH